MLLASHFGSKQTDDIRRARFVNRITQMGTVVNLKRLVVIVLLQPQKPFRCQRTMRVAVDILQVRAKQLGREYGLGMSLFLSSNNRPSLVIWHQTAPCEYIWPRNQDGGDPLLPRVFPPRSPVFFFFFFFL